MAAKRKKSKLKKFLLYAVIGCVLLIALPITSALIFPRFTYNLFVVALEPYYYIPDQSSIFTFRPTMSGGGSEPLWIYGEDKIYYYYNDTFNDITGSPIAFPKNETASCPGFDPKEIYTWCQFAPRHLIYETP
ncbi:MAG: hypothetical protein LBV79_11015 [Candidatus Adiutrix sp.]|nr:hypothetical protein [Candidatus Adiutrix sp.]